MNKNPSRFTAFATTLTRRRVLQYIGSLALLYPVLKFIGYTIPKKPNYVKITSPIPLGGVLTTSEFVLFDKGDTCWALSRKCSHLGCKIHYNEITDTLECPCHHSRFHATTGEVIIGPAQRPLTSFPVEKRSESPYYIITT